eukprot:jgi/Astpho2/6110/Aster-04056
MAWPQQASALAALLSESCPLQVMLLSDGSVTRHLQLLTGLVVSVDCLQMERIARESVEDLPEQVETIPGDLVQRQVFLRSPGEDHLPLVYAASWWSADHVDEFLRDKQQPIWASLSQGHIELFREIQQVHYGNSEFLEESFREKGPFLGRHYLFWHHGRPLTVIYEVFSPKLSRWLGPMHQ